MNKKVVFVCGANHSGSTMLDMMIANNNECYSVGEVSAYFWPTRTHHRNPICGCGVYDCEKWNGIKEDGYKNLYNEIFNRNPNISVIVDSSKKPSWIGLQSKNLNRFDIQAYYVVIWKSPGQISKSLIKRGRISKFHKIWTSYYEKISQIVKNPLFIKYRNLVNDPDKTLKTIDKYIGIEYYKNQKYYWEKKHHTLFGSASSRISLHEKDSEEYNRLINYIRNNTKGNKSCDSYYRKILKKSNVEHNIPKKYNSKIIDQKRVKMVKKYLKNRASSSEIVSDVRRIYILFKLFLLEPFLAQLIKALHLDKFNSIVNESTYFRNK